MNCCAGIIIWNYFIFKINYASSRKLESKFQSKTLILTDGWSCYDDGDVKEDVGFYIADLESTFYRYIIPLVTIKNLEQLGIFAPKLYVSSLISRSISVLLWWKPFITMVLVNIFYSWFSCSCILKKNYFSPELNILIRKAYA